MTFYKKNKSDTILWVDTPDRNGIMEFTFDKKTIFNLFRDYPEKLTKQQKEIFDRENPFWKDFFADRQ